MFKLLFTSSENHKNFGVSKVVISLNKEIKKKKIKSLFSNNLVKFLIFKPDIIHINGCWKLRLILFFILAKIFQIRIVISPHGMMDPISLKQKSFKKKIALLIYQKFIFKNSNLIIVNSELEKKNLLKITKNITKIVIIPHGIYIDKNFQITSNQYKDLRFVFFSRIHKSKNLERLINLWKNEIFFDKLNLDIYGEIVDNAYFSKIDKTIQDNKNINYIGSLNNNIQQNLSKYDVLIHPSNSENFGLVIYEGLSSGLFLILNKKLKKISLEKQNFAKNINFNSKELIRIIKNIKKNKKKIKGISYKKKSLNFVKNNFNWQSISIKYLKNYKRILKK